MIRRAALLALVLLLVSVPVAALIRVAAFEVQAPSTLVVMGSGLILLGMIYRRRRAIGSSKRS